MNTTTNDFPIGSEFIAVWETRRRNPRYRGGYAWNGVHPEIITVHKSPVFDTYEEALEFGQAYGREGRVKIRRPGFKNFIPTYAVKGLA